MRFSYLLPLAALPPTLMLLVGLSTAPPRNPGITPAHTLEANLNVPAPVQEVLKRACMNCHSNQTRWPWYSKAPLISRFVHRDVERGRAAMNFSEWSTGVGNSPERASGLLLAACATMRQHMMPKNPYPLFHPEARLSHQDIEMFCAWTDEQSKQIKASRRTFLKPNARLRPQVKGPGPS